MATQEQKTPKSFEEKVARLEEISSKMRTDAISLEESLALFKEGMGLGREVQAYLKDVEQKVEFISDEAKKPLEEAGVDLASFVEEVPATPVAMASFATKTATAAKKTADATPRGLSIFDEEPEEDFEWEEEEEFSFDDEPSLF